MMLGKVVYPKPISISFRVHTGSVGLHAFVIDYSCLPYKIELTTPGECPAVQIWLGSSVYICCYNHSNAGIEIVL